MNVHHREQPCLTLMMFPPPARVTARRPPGIRELHEQRSVISRVEAEEHACMLLL